MALTVNHIAAADLSDTTGGDPITIPSFSMVSGRLYCIAIISASTTDRTISSITLPGGGTPVIIGEVWRTTDFGLHCVYCLCTSDGTGTGSIDFSGANAGTCISVDEWIGIDPADPVIDANYAESTGTGSVAPIPMSFVLPNAITRPNNAIWGAFAVDNVAVMAPGTDYTETFDAGHSSPTRRLGTQYDISPVDLTFDATNNGATVGWGGIAFEINEGPADSLFFDGVDDYIRFDNGDAAGGTDSHTVAVIAKLATDEAAYRQFVGVNALDSIFGHDNVLPANLVWFPGAGGAATSTFSIPASDGWCIYAFHGPSGGGRFHKYVFATDTWTHEANADGFSAVAALTDIWIGRSGDAGSPAYMDANFLVAAWWDTDLSDLDLETLSNGLLAWVEAAPAELFRFNSIGAISSLIGSATETTRVGTTLDVGDAPTGWSDDLPEVVTKQTLYAVRRRMVRR